MSATALTYKCPHCGYMVEVSEGLLGEKVECPQENCGLPFTPEVPHVQPATPMEEKKHGPARAKIDKPADDEENVMVVHPAMFRNNPIGFLAVWSGVIFGLIGVVAALMGIGLSINEQQILGASLLLMIGGAIALFSIVMLLMWYLRVYMTELTITSERSILRRGIIARETSEVRHTDVRNLQVDQSFVQRLLGVGDLAISSSGQDDLEVVVEAIPNPSGVADVIRDRQ